eukprot:gene11860-12410_t
MRKAINRAEPNCQIPIPDAPAAVTWGNKHLTVVHFATADAQYPISLRGFHLLLHKQIRKVRSDLEDSGFAVNELCGIPQTKQVMCLSSAGEEGAVVYRERTCYSCKQCRAGEGERRGRRERQFAERMAMERLYLEMMPTVLRDG